ncbi:hypothetical protein IFM89_007079 [Coptis chinensis]|uniref:Uncharacterized protein n=1 Tax=Coptis chinensis TaxID=261450 RepID=A0A835H2E4_9MAGN|nr:hypothetical protein IFM89_007079 [Coptis chinensis]
MTCETLVLYTRVHLRNCPFVAAAMRSPNPLGIMIAEVLESLVKSGLPTRAEITDVANGRRAMSYHLSVPHFQLSRLHSGAPTSSLHSQGAFLHSKGSVILLDVQLSPDPWTAIMLPPKVLGFGDYIEDVYAAYEQHKLETMDSPKAGKWSGEKMTEEEALAEQQRMFAEARARMNGGVNITKHSDSDRSLES